MASLHDLPINKIGIINKINTNDNIRERLHSFGLIDGVAIKPIKNSPLGCPRIYRCLNTNIAIRNKTAKFIEILYEK
ncbi:ferrous iron transport protein A [Candidatus Parcubacteria bacterium]|nr:ferrous iron transport protein A [Candidatus Parcubacteria bacterium]